MRTFSKQIFQTCTLVVCLILLSTFVFAQEEEQEPDPVDYQVTVTGDRLEEPLTDKSDAITVITSKQIEENQINYVLDALRLVPGVSIVQSGSPGKTTSIFLRGAGAAQTLVLLDGVPINNPYFGGLNVEDLTTQNVERIEVLKGPQSPLYGSDSIGGVIQIISKKGSGEAEFRTTFEGGSFETFREGISLNGAQGAVDYAVSFSRQDSEGQFDNDEFAENVFSGRLGYEWNDSTNADFIVNLFDSSIGIPFHTVFDPATFALILEPSPLQSQESNLAVFSGRVKHFDGALLNLTTQFSYTRRTFSFDDPGSFFAASTNDSDIYQFTFQNDSVWNDQNVLTAGYEFEHQDIHAQDTQNGVYPLQSVNNHALFLQNKFENQSWILTAGLRFDHYNTFGESFNPRFSIAYKLQENARVRGSYGEGFRAPAAGDLALPFYGNPDLKPEKSRSWEIGFDHSIDNSISWGAGYFHNDYDELITFDPNTLIAGNVAEASAWGVEVYANYSLNGWSFGGGYTYLDTEDETTQLPLYRRPEHSGFVQVGYQQSRWGVSIMTTAVGERFENDFLAFPVQNVFLPGYGRVNIAGHYQILESVRLKGRVENLLDKEYEEILYFPALPRGFYGGFEWTF